jgi:hypothetical protein
MQLVDSIVFDLDKTLIYTSSSSVSELHQSGILEDPKFFPVQKRVYYFDLPSSRPSKGDKPNVEGVTSMWGTLRPYAREFLEFCFKRFKRVIVFTAGTADYAIPICDVLFRGISKPYMIWARGHCLRVREKARDVDKRLVDLGYYPSLSVSPDSEEFEYMNAKLLDRVAQAVAEVEDDYTITKNQFIIVEDNYHSFITHDFHNAFLIPAYESSSKSDPTALPGSPGYSPARQKLLSNAGVEDGEDDDEDDFEEPGDGDHGYKGRSLVDIPIKQTPPPTRLRKNAKYSWLLYPDNTLQRLQRFIEDFPDYDAKMYTDGWNNMN